MQFSDRSDVSAISSMSQLIIITFQSDGKICIAEDHEMQKSCILILHIIKCQAYVIVGYRSSHTSSLSLPYVHSQNSLHSPPITNHQSFLNFIPSDIFLAHLPQGFKLVKKLPVASLGPLKSAGR